MPLPSPELLGLTDPREVSGAPARPAPAEPATRQAAAVAAPARAAPAEPPTQPAATVAAAAAGPPPPQLTASRLTPVSRREPAEARPAPEGRTFVQIMVAPEVRERLADASFALEDVRPGWHLQQTIVGALIARHIRPDDPAAMDALLERLAAWTENPLSGRRGEALKLGWRLPHSLTRRVDKAVLRLRASHRHLQPSAKALLASLIVGELAAQTPADVDRLIELVAPYVDQYERPNQLAVVAPPAVAH